MMESKQAKDAVIPQKILEQNAGQLYKVQLAARPGEMLVAVATKPEVNKCTRAPPW